MSELGINSNYYNNTVNTISSSFCFVFIIWRPGFSTTITGTLELNSIKLCVCVLRGCCVFCWVGDRSSEFDRVGQSWCGASGVTKCDHHRVQ